MHEAVAQQIAGVVNGAAPQDRDLHFGATLLGAAQTRFRFWAPALSHVGLEIEDHAPIAMRPLAGGWFEAEAPCGAGAAYKFRVAEDLAVTDPAARAVRGDAYGHSLVVDPRAYQWRNEEWRGRPWAETVLYELHVGAFGGFKGVRDALPRLAELGVTAVELMPISAFPGRLNWGYDGVLPYAPSSHYGAPDELKELVDAAHGLGLMMFLDVVYNHFGPEGNYVGRYAPPFFRREHNAWGCAIDFSRAEVRRFYAENALYWLRDFRFDGLRFDAAHAIARPDWLDETAAELRARMPPGRLVHLVLENDENVASHMRDGFFNAQWNDDGHHVLHVLLTGEKIGYYAAYADDPAGKLARALREGFVYQGEPSPVRGGKRRGAPSADLPPSAFVLFLQNHDQIGNRAFGERLTALASRRALEAAIALQLLCPQVPLVFMGEEDASRSPFLFFAEHNEELAQAIREGRKREFEAVANARGELPDPADFETFDRSIPAPDRRLAAERFDLYRRLLALRREHIAPRLEGARALDAQALGRAAAVARWRLGDGKRLTIVVNLDCAAVNCPCPEGDLLFESSLDACEVLRTGMLLSKTTMAFLQT
jgi:maltooligosyltrehalose trehalohydrolase